MLLTVFTTLNIGLSFQFITVKAAKYDVINPRACVWFCRSRCYIARKIVLHKWGRNFINKAEFHYSISKSLHTLYEAILPTQSVRMNFLLYSCCKIKSDWATHATCCVPVVLPLPVVQLSYSSPKYHSRSHSHLHTLKENKQKVRLENKHSFWDFHSRGGSGI